MMSSDLLHLDPNRYFCHPCTRGRSSVAGSEICESCTPGRYAAKSGVAACVACPAGYYQPHHEEIFCDMCLPGQHQTMSGQVTCGETTLAVVAPTAGKQKSGAGTLHAWAKEITPSPEALIGVFLLAA